MEAQGRLAVLKALGDNTRYAIYLELARSPSPLSTIEIAEVRHIALNGRYMLSDLFDRRIQFLLAAARDENVSPFVNKPLRCGKANAAIAASDQGNFSFELSDVFLANGHLFAV